MEEVGTTSSILVSKRERSSVTKCVFQTGPLKRYLSHKNPGLLWVPLPTTPWARLSHDVPIHEMLNSSSVSFFINQCSVILSKISLPITLYAELAKRVLLT